MEQHYQRHTAGAAQHNQTNEPECPICISEPRFAIKTNCGHLFCGKVQCALITVMLKMADNQLSQLLVAKTDKMLSYCRENSTSVMHLIVARLLSLTVILLSPIYIARYII